MKKCFIVILMAALLFVFIGGCAEGGGAGSSATTSMLAASAPWGLSCSKYNMALASDGTVWVWRSVSASPTAPVQIQGLENITSIAANGRNAAALQSDGTLWTWEFNRRNGDWFTSPVQRREITDAIAVAVWDSIVVLRSDGTLWKWCQGLYCDRDALIQVQGLNNLIAITERGFALRNDGTVWLWDDYCDYCDWDIWCCCVPERPAPPLQIQGLSNITAIDDRMALRNDGTVWTWTTFCVEDRNHAPAVQVQGLNDIIAISSDTTSSGELRRDAALRSDGTVWALGQERTAASAWELERTAPVQVQNLTDVTAIATNGVVVALRSDGTVWSEGLKWSCDCDCEHECSRGGTFIVCNLIPPVQVPGPDGEGFLNLLN